MKKYFYNILFSISLLCLTGYIAAQNMDYPKKVIGGKEYYEYPVQKSEGFYSISKRFNVTQEEIKKINPGVEKGLTEGAILLIPVEKGDFIIHKVEKKETLFSLTQKYDITYDELYSLNPQVKQEGLKYGAEVKIPKKSVSANSMTVGETMPKAEKKNSPGFKTHEVKKGETLYSISKKYETTTEEIVRLNPETSNGIKVGNILIIPPATSGVSSGTPPALSSEVSAVKPDFETLFVRSTGPKNTINIALALPFSFGKITENSKIDGNTDKFIEFYQGILLAIDSLKKQGLSFNLHVYDSGKSEMEVKAMLGNIELKNMDILIGPAYTVQVKPMSDFAMMNNIKLVIPFSSKAEETKSNPNIFQVNTSQEQLNKLIADQFVARFSNSNVILLRFKTAAYNDKATFADVLEEALKARNVKYTTVWYDLIENIRKELSDVKDNIIVPLTTNQVALSQALPVINMLGEKKNVSLFGFPEWQTYPSISKELFRQNTYIANSFFVDYKDRDVKNFLKKYRYFYNAEPANTVPQYSLLGYDIVMFFSEVISRYGHDFEKELEKFNMKLLQMNLKFKQINENGGYYNSNVYLINHNDVTGITDVNK